LFQRKELALLRIEVRIEQTEGKEVDRYTL